MSFFKLKARGKILINPQFQLAFLAHSLSIVIGLAGVFALANAYFFWQFVHAAERLNLPPSHPVFAFVQHQQSVITVAAALVSLVLGVIVAAWSIYFSHRVAGPLERLKNQMNRPLEGELPRPVHFRDKDFFNELAVAYNKHLEHLKKELDARDVA